MTSIRTPLNFQYPLDNNFDYDYKEKTDNDDKNKKEQNKTKINFDSNFIKGRYQKIKDENHQLKQQIYELQKENKFTKSEMEKRILFLRDENSNLQLQIQKNMEKEKNLYKNNDDINNKMKCLLENEALYKKEISNLKEAVSQKSKEISEIKELLSTITNEKKILENQIINMNKDQDAIIQKMTSIGGLLDSDFVSEEKKRNEERENNLKKYSKKLTILNGIIEKLKKENSFLLKENKENKNLNKILSEKNERLLQEINYIYSRNVRLINSIEKIDINKQQLESLYKKNINSRRRNQIRNPFGISICNSVLNISTNSHSKSLRNHRYNTEKNEIRHNKNLTDFGELFNTAKLELEPKLLRRIRRGNNRSDKLCSAYKTPRELKKNLKELKDDTLSRQKDSTGTTTLTKKFYETTFQKITKPNKSVLNTRNYETKSLNLTNSSLFNFSRNGFDKESNKSINIRKKKNNVLIKGINNNSNIIGDSNNNTLKNNCAIEKLKKYYNCNFRSSQAKSLLSEYDENLNY